MRIAHQNDVYQRDTQGGVQMTYLYLCHLSLGIQCPTQGIRAEQFACFKRTRRSAAWKIIPVMALRRLCLWLSVKISAISFPFLSLMVLEYIS